MGVSKHRGQIVMKCLRPLLASVIVTLPLTTQCANAQDTSVENFAIAALNVEKAHVIEGIYYLTKLLPRQCHDGNIDSAAADFRVSANGNFQ